MRKMRQLGVVATLLVLTVLSAPGTAGAAGFDQFIVFGDSTLDTGYFRYHAVGKRGIRYGACRWPFSKAPRAGAPEMGS